MTAANMTWWRWESMVYTKEWRTMPFIIANWIGVNYSNIGSIAKKNGLRSFLGKLPRLLNMSNSHCVKYYNKFVSKWLIILLEAWHRIYSCVSGATFDECDMFPWKAPLFFDNFDCIPSLILDLTWYSLFSLSMMRFNFETCPPVVSD